MKPTLERARFSIAQNAARRRLAPELKGGGSWLDVARPLSFETDLAGHVTLFHFFTPSRVACWATIEHVAFLERKYRESGLAIVGVFEPRFAHEGTRNGARAALLRFGVEHPVVVDSQGSIARDFEISQRPTLVLVGADGVQLARFEASTRFDPEFRESIDAACEAALEFERRCGRLAPRDLPLRLERYRALPRELAYPARLARHPTKPLLYVSDANHDRVLEIGIDGTFQRAFGVGTPGFKDGAANDARFLRPQGLAVIEHAMFVADAGNHAIRRIDLDTGEVSTLAGNGRRGRAPLASNDPRSVALDAPLDVVIDSSGRSLFVALAGAHAIARVACDGSSFEPFAGDGTERSGNGPLATATFAQPSGLAYTEGALFVADAGSSSIRAIDLASGLVRTLAGGSAVAADLEHSGEDDGRGSGRRFMLPLGIAAAESGIIVADAGNNQLKLVNPVTGDVTTVAGLGAPGHLDGPDEDARFFEPSGVALCGRRVMIADSANHSLRFLELATGAVGTLTLRGVPLPRPRISSRARSDELPDVPPELPGTVLHSREERRVTPGVVTVEIALETPPGFELADEGPSQFHVRRMRGAIDIEHAKGKIRGPTFAIPLYVDGPGEIEIVCAWYTCCGDACRLRVSRFPLSFTVGPEGTDHVRLRDSIALDRT